MCPCFEGGSYWYSHGFIRNHFGFRRPLGHWTMGAWGLLEVLGLSGSTMGLSFQNTPRKEVQCRDRLID